MSTCLQCNNVLSRRPSIYCSNKCQSDHAYDQYILLWKQGKVSGGRGVLAKNLSSHVRKYLRIKYGDKCSLCGWSKINPVTNHVPLEIDHIDGNSENNLEDNLRIICPNCHSLTPSYRNLNIGKGRSWRKLKYVKNF